MGGRGRGSVGMISTSAVGHLVVVRNCLLCKLTDKRQDYTPVMSTHLFNHLFIWAQQSSCANIQMKGISIYGQGQQAHSSHE